MLNIWAANLADLLIGDPYWFPHPVRFIGSYIMFYEKNIRKLCKSRQSLKTAGIFLTISTILISYGTAWMILKLSVSIGDWLSFALNAAIMYTCLAGRCLHKEAYIIMNALYDGDLSKGRKLLSYIVGRDTDNLDQSGIARAVIETVSENTSDGIIAPLFYMFLGGAPLAIAYKAINTLDSMVGYKNEKYMDFGWASAKLDDIANYVPARLTAFFIIMGAFILRMNYKGSFKVVFRDGRNHLSPNSGYPEAAAAGALDIRLGGENYYFGKPVVKPTIGDNLRSIESDNIKQMVSLMYGSWFTALMGFSVVNYFLRGFNI